MALAFLDTSFYILRFLKTSASAAVSNVVEDPASTNYITELTIVEWMSALARRYKSRDLDMSGVTNNMSRLMHDIVAGRVSVFNIGNEVYDRAVHLLKYAAIEERRALDTQDALLLCTAIELASVAKSPLTLYTADRRFARIILDLRIARPYVTPQFVDPGFKGPNLIRRIVRAVASVGDRLWR